MTNRSFARGLTATALAFLAVSVAACDADANRVAASDAAPIEPAATTPRDAASTAAPGEDKTREGPPPRDVGLPIRRGVYVTSGSDCASPPNAGFRTYDGRGLSGSSTRACRAAVIGREGVILRVRQSCEDTYSGRRTSSDLTLEGLGDDGFRLTEAGEGAMTFRLCPADQVPGYLQQMTETPAA